jgi:hypothetical protein
VAGFITEFAIETMKSLACFIIEFTVDTVKSYSAEEKEFLRIPRGRYIRSLYASIKKILYNKGVMTMESDS